MTKEKQSLITGKIFGLLANFAVIFIIFQFGRHVGKLEATPEPIPQITTVFEDIHTYCFQYENDPKVYCSSKNIKDLWYQK